MIRLGCLIAIMNSTASVCVSLVSLLFFIVIGVISNRLKPHHLYHFMMIVNSRIKELQILFQSDEVSSNLQLDQYQYQQVRNELYRLRSLLLEVRKVVCLNWRTQLCWHPSVVIIEQNWISSFIRHIWYSFHFLFFLMHSQVIFF